MFGWEFPPYNKGGLGTACYGLSKGLSKEGIDISFVLPRKLDLNSDYIKFVFGEGGKSNYIINSLLEPYMAPKNFDEKRFGEDGGNENDKEDRDNSQNKGIYGKDLFSEVERYASIAGDIAEKESFDIIHAHDWMTFKAGIAAKKRTNKPLVVHIHATEFDRTGGNGNNSIVYEIEKEGFQSADLIIAVSNFTKKMVVDKYNIDPLKIRVVHNSVEFENYTLEKAHSLSDCNKLILFLGRITLQKGPDYFIEAAKKVLDYYPNVYFIIAGSGDMDRDIIKRVIEMGISDKVLFAGFLRGSDVHKAFQMCDLYVMPSVSEPFGISPLESLMNKTPVLISKQSGVSEVLKNCLKADFWDIDELTNKMVSVLRYNELKKCLTENGHNEVKTMDWRNSAKKCVDVYNELFNLKSPNLINPSKGVN